MDTYYQNLYVQNQLKFETYQPQILMKSRTSQPVQDFSIPLHVDCSVEYELPECAKPPQGVKIEPLLMIHPCYFRNLERQRRRPFENNMPQNTLLALDQQPKHQRYSNSNNNNNNINNINHNLGNNTILHKQQQQQLHHIHPHHQQQQQIIPTTNNRNSSNTNNNSNNNNNSKLNTNNNYIYNCDFAANVAEYHRNSNNMNNNTNNNSLINNNNNSNVQRYRNNSNLVRNHPYAMPCAPRYADMNYSTSHLPTLIFNI